MNAVEHILTYGTLRKGAASEAKMQHMRFIGTRKLWNYALYNLGWFPGVRQTNDPKLYVVCDLWEVTRPQEIYNLDRYEGYYQDDEQASLFIRRIVTVGETQAWLYVYNMDVRDNHKLIKTGDWLNQNA